MKLLVSIHDVMPRTLDRVERVFDRLAGAGLVPITLLIVPGTGWTPVDLDRLRALFDRGGEPAGHGWHHHTPRIRGLRHRVHSALISRNVAEHLALSRFGILRLMARNFRWFAEHDLPAPALYVPPAWAMGPVPRALLDRLPFRRYETLAGVYDATAGRFHRLPMVGFEADTRLRAVTVAAFNAANVALARRTGRALRLGVHPDDFELELAADLSGMIDAGGEPVSYASLSASPA